ncbi:hypothetical protein [Azospirillum halopraeferens]|uniref:hypothetical protein n=1 Tax=Azospirillum halopraeferens TaxID=34010 RepID=UPI000428839A|nr:hypothetical protein [Azospirillum halopraeferens]
MTDFLPVYYDTVRRLLATGDPDMRLTHVGLGTSGAPDAETLTDAVLVPIAEVHLPPDQPRKALLHWRVPAGTATGLMVREIGLLRADGVLVARRVRASAIEKTGDMEIGDLWDIDV